MEFQTLLILFGAFFLIAFLYSSVGHAGASGYLAIMALFSFPVDSIKPISLVLNIVVAAIATYKFIGAGYFDRKIFLAFAITSTPMAFVGGYFKIDPYWFKILAGIFLILSAGLLLGRQFIRTTDKKRELNVPVAVGMGAVIGLLSGLLGVGGGIFLSPILILMGWTTVKQASGIAALFILCNSVLGLTGHYAALKYIPAEAFYFVAAVTLGGFIGAHYGSQKFNNKLILAFLFLVLLSAGVKFLWVG